MNQSSPSYSCLSKLMDLPTFGVERKGRGPLVNHSKPGNKGKSVVRLPSACGKFAHIASYRLTHRSPLPAKWVSQGRSLSRAMASIGRRREMKSRPSTQATSTTNARAQSMIIEASSMYSGSYPPVIQSY